MYDLDRIKKEFKETCDKAGVKLTTPIYINSRLSTTLGQVVFDGEDTPLKIDFSKTFLETATDEAVHQVILHEAAHYIAAKRDGVSHGHDAYFKAICDEIGCTNNKTTYKVERVKGIIGVYKYDVFCPNCGRIKGYNRKTQILDHLDRCHCRGCGSKGLWYVKNR